MIGADVIDSKEPVLGGENLPGESNPNIVYYLTEYGGHIGWPTTMIPKNFEYINKVFTKFFDSSLYESPKSNL